MYGGSRGEDKCLEEKESNICFCLYLSLTLTHTHKHTRTHRSINADGLLEDKSKTQRSFHTHAVLNKAGFVLDKDKQKYVCHLLVLKLLLSVSLRCWDNTKNKLQH